MCNTHPVEKQFVLVTQKKNWVVRISSFRERENIAIDLQKLKHHKQKNPRKNNIAKFFLNGCFLLQNSDFKIVLNCRNLVSTRNKFTDFISMNSWMNQSEWTHNRLPASCPTPPRHRYNLSLCQHFYSNIDTPLQPAFQKWFIAAVQEIITLRIWMLFEYFVKHCFYNLVSPALPGILLLYCNNSGNVATRVDYLSSGSSYKPLTYLHYCQFI